MDDAFETAPELVTFGAEAFVSEAYARAEPERLWRKVWQPACRLEEIPDVGDYLVYDIVDDTVLIVRSAPDEISAFHNVCAHRGRRLAAGCGHAREFRCAYHAWRYDLKGRNVFVLDKADWGGRLPPGRLDLPPVEADVWGGWVWVNLDPGCGPLREHLEPLAGLLDPFEFEKMRYRWRKWSYFDCNWKVAMEAFIESYHVEGTHPQLVKLADFYTWSRADGAHSHHGFDERSPELDLAANNTILRTGRGADPRVSIARLQREVYDTVDAATTLTFVTAAERLVDELPEGAPADEVMAHFMESARRDDAARGVDWPQIAPEHLAKSGIAGHIFPNLAVGYGITFALVYRVRPCGHDPNRCIFEAAFLERWPEGGEPATEWVYVDPAEPQNWPPVLLQDFANMTEVQRGMRASGFRGTLPNPRQEEPVSNFHRTLAKYMGTGAPRPLG